VYHQFLAIVKHLQDETKPAPEVMRSICTLLQARPGLLEGFNALLPSGYRIHCNSSAGVEASNGVRDGREKGKVVNISLTTPEGSVLWRPDGEDDVADDLETGRTSQIHNETPPVRGPLEIRIQPSQEPLAPVAPAITSRELPDVDDFGNAVKNRFGNDLATYTEFLEIMGEFEAKIKDVKAVSEHKAVVAALYLRFGFAD
jgi:histone deacetylase complex regulatory component SIN3